MDWLNDNALIISAHTGKRFAESGADLGMLCTTTGSVYPGAVIYWICSSHAELIKR